MTSVIVTPLFGIGDMLMATPALELLHRHRPDVRVTVAAFHKSIADMLQGNPAVHAIDFLPLLSMPKPKGLAEILRRYRNKYDISLTFYPSNRKDYSVFSLLTGAKQRIGHRYQRSNIQELNFLKNKTVTEDDSLHCVEENIRLLQYFNIPMPESDLPSMHLYLTSEERQWAKDYLSSIQTGKPIIGVHAGCSIFKGHINRRLPASTFTTIADKLTQCTLLLFGGKEDADANDYILQHTIRKNDVIHVQTPTLRHAAAVIEQLPIFLSNDSGLMHVAAAVGTPVVAVLGPTNPAYIHPWNVPYNIASLHTPCSPCFYYSPKPLTCSQQDQFYCLRSLSAEHVIEQIENLFVRSEHYNNNRK